MQVDEQTKILDRYAYEIDINKGVWNIHIHW